MKTDLPRNAVLFHPLCIFRGSRLTALYVLLFSVSPFFVSLLGFFFFQPLGYKRQAPFPLAFFIPAFQRELEGRANGGQIVSHQLQFTDDFSGW